MTDDVNTVDSSNTAKAPESHQGDLPLQEVSIFGDEPVKEEKPAETKEEVSAPPDKEPSEPEKGESVSAPEAAESKPDRDNAETRKAKLAGEIHELLRQRAQIRDELEKAQQQPKPKTAAPKEEDYPDYPSYIKATAEFEAKEAIAKARHEETLKAQQDAINELEKQTSAAWAKRANLAQNRLPELNKAIEAGSKKEIPMNPTMAGFIMKREYGPDILHALWKDPELAMSISEMDPFDSACEMHNLEMKIATQVKGIKKKSSVDVVPKVAGKESSPTTPKSTEDILYG